jgi:hypothetical protein
MFSLIFRQYIQLLIDCAIDSGLVLAVASHYIVLHRPSIQQAVLFEEANMMNQFITYICKPLTVNGSSWLCTWVEIFSLYFQTSGI